MNKLLETREEKFGFSLFLFLALIKIVLIHPTFSDDIFYFNVAKSILSGLTPYKDFFFAHPPLHEYLLTLLFALFGPSIFIGKLLATLSSLASALLLYYISKKSFEREREETAFYSVLFFLFSPIFLAFSSIGYGMWETMLLLLLSIYLYLKNKIFLSSTFFSLSVFTRYFSLLYLPLFIVLPTHDRKNRPKFLAYSTVLLFGILSLFLLIFGWNFIGQTVIFHIMSKMGVPVFPQVYLKINAFFIFIALLALGSGRRKGEKDLRRIAVSILLIDSLITLIFKNPFCHYFLLSVPFYSLISGAFFQKKRRLLKSLIILTFLLSILINFRTLNFYLNPRYGKIFYEISRIIEIHSSKDSTIFGEPIMTNYISFTLERRIAANYLDSYPQHIKSEENKLLTLLEEEPPSIFIDAKVMNTSYLSNFLGIKGFVQQNYKEIARIQEYPLDYRLLLLKTSKKI